MEKKHVIKLTPKERRRCIAIVSKGRNKASVIRRAHIVLKSDEGKSDREISELLYISEETVRRIRVRFLETSIKSARIVSWDGTFDEEDDGWFIDDVSVTDALETPTRPPLFVDPS